jgi:hypothetical protein
LPVGEARLRGSLRPAQPRPRASLEILWESATAADAEVNAKEIERIRPLNANDPAIGYNRWPKPNPKDSAADKGMGAPNKEDTFHRFLGDAPLGPTIEDRVIQ